MYTQDSLTLKRYHFGKINPKGSNELRKLYTFLHKINLLDIEDDGDMVTENISNVNIDSPFVTENVKKDLLKMKRKTFGKVKIGDINLTFNVFHKPNEKVDKFINETLDLIHFLFSIYPVNRDIEINLYLSDAKKELPNYYNEDAFIFGRDQANSGSCLRKEKESIVHIWRKEEILKVTIHELIHALCIDQFNDSLDIIKHYQNKYQISSDIINTNEAYTEMWANLINCFWISQKVKKDSYNFFKTLIALEKEHCLFQSLKIFKLSKLNEEVIDINKDTNILAYYIIRCELFHNITKFLELCRKNNYLKINVNGWFSLLKGNTMIKKNDKKISRLKILDFKYKTTRMTCIEYKLF